MINIKSISASVILILLFLFIQSCEKEKGYKSITDIDGNVYHSIIIGTQVWMIENLKTTKYCNGDPIPNITDNTWGDQSTGGAYCNYNNNTVYSITYGRLYNWAAITDKRGIAPVGWHIPSNAEWTILTTYLGGESVAGGKLKESGISHWAGPNTGATNETGFRALPGGFCSNGGYFLDLGITGYWWSLTESSVSGDAFCSEMTCYSNSVSLSAFGYKWFGYSVRCIKNN
jgi:uncharacterized protein (TIGR02145 family)